MRERLGLLAGALLALVLLYFFVGEQQALQLTQEERLAAEVKRDLAMAQPVNIGRDQVPFAERRPGADGVRFSVLAGGEVFPSNGRLQHSAPGGSMLAATVESGFGAIAKDQVDHFLGDAFVGWFVPDRGFAASVVEVRRNQSNRPELGELVLSIGDVRELHVQVTDLRGAPLAGATLRMQRGGPARELEVACDEEGRWGGEVAGDVSDGLWARAPGYGRGGAGLGPQALSETPIQIQLGRILAAGVVLDQRERGRLRLRLQGSLDYVNSSQPVDYLPHLESVEEGLAIDPLFERVRWRVVLERSWADLNDAELEATWFPTEGTARELEIPLKHVVDPSLSPVRFPVGDGPADFVPVDIQLEPLSSGRRARPNVIGLLWFDQTVEGGGVFRVGRVVREEGAFLYRFFVPPGTYSVEGVPRSDRHYQRDLAPQISPITQVRATDEIVPPARYVAELAEGCFYANYVVTDRAGAPLPQGWLVRPALESGKYPVYLTPASPLAKERFFSESHEYQVLVAREPLSPVTPLDEEIALAEPSADSVLRIPVELSRITPEPNQED